MRGDNYCFMAPLTPCTHSGDTLEIMGVEALRKVLIENCSHSVGVVLLCV